MPLERLEWESPYDFQTAIVFIGSCFQTGFVMPTDEVVCVALLSAGVGAFAFVLSRFRVQIELVFAAERAFFGASLIAAHVEWTAEHLKQLEEWRPVILKFWHEISLVKEDRFVWLFPAPRPSRWWSRRSQLLECFQGFRCDPPLRPANLFAAHIDGPQLAALDPTQNCVFAHSEPLAEVFDRVGAAIHRGAPSLDMGRSLLWRLTRSRAARDRRSKSSEARSPSSTASRRSSSASDKLCKAVSRAAVSGTFFIPEH